MDLEPAGGHAAAVGAALGQLLLGPPAQAEAGREEGGEQPRDTGARDDRSKGRGALEVDSRNAAKSLLCIIKGRLRTKDSD